MQQELSADLLEISNSIRCFADSRHAKGSIFTVLCWKPCPVLWKAPRPESFFGQKGSDEVFIFEDVVDTVILCNVCLQVYKPTVPVSLNRASVPFPSRATREFPWVFLVPRTFLVQGHYHHWAGGVPSINPRSFKWASIQPSEATEWLKDLNLDHADAEDPVDVGAMSYRLRFMGSILNGNSIPNGNMKLSCLVASVAFLILIVSECLGDLMKKRLKYITVKAGKVCLWPLYIWVLDPQVV